jgi:Family of unknown function (DUF6364)
MVESGATLGGTPTTRGRNGPAILSIGQIYRDIVQLADGGQAQACEAQPALTHNKGFPYYGCMNITLSLDDKLVKEVRKIAVDRDTTLTGLVREYLERLAAESAATGRKRRELEALERSFKKYQLDMGKKTWTRADLYDRK